MVLWAVGAFEIALKACQISSGPQEDFGFQTI
jgi:hypothetical protein